MQISRTVIVAGIAAIVALFLLGERFTVSETEQAIVLQFGAVQHIDRTAGSKFKIPSI